MAVADVYDAPISRRIYKDGMPHEKAAGIMVNDRGTDFDPAIVDAFVELQGEFQAIAARGTGCSARSAPDPPATESVEPRR